MTQLVAKKLGAGEESEIPSLAWTSLLLMLLLGLVGAAVAVLASPWLVHRVLHIPGALQVEALGSFYLLGLSIPVVINTSGLRGLLEAYQRFALINALRIPMGVFTFAGPLLVLPFSRSLFPVVAVPFAARRVPAGAGRPRGLAGVAPRPARLTRRAAPLRALIRVCSRGSL